METKKKFILIAFASLAFLIAFLFLSYKKVDENQLPEQKLEKETPANRIINYPLERALSRITKKPFGIYVNPNNSPVRPERFTGYHTGTDFEIERQEATMPVPVKAICDGDITLRQTISGYGGVIVQQCTFASQLVSVIYGHVNLTTATTNQRVLKNEFLVDLAPAYSVESGGERKHLHLGIIMGGKLDYRGYVQDQAELKNWLNPVDF